MLNRSDGLDVRYRDEKEEALMPRNNQTTLYVGLWGLNLCRHLGLIVRWSDAGAVTKGMCDVILRLESRPGVLRENKSLPSLL